MSRKALTITCCAQRTIARPDLCASCLRYQFSMNDAPLGFGKGLLYGKWFSHHDIKPIRALLGHVMVSPPSYTAYYGINTNCRDLGNVR